MNFLGLALLKRGLPDPGCWNQKKFETLCSAAAFSPSACNNLGPGPVGTKEALNAQKHKTPATAATQP